MNKNSNYIAIISALALAIFLRLFLIAVYKIPTDSMSPILSSGDFIFSSQIAYGLKFPWSSDVLFPSEPKKGDLIAVTFKNRPAITYIKQVVAVFGDEFEMNQGVLYINGTKVSESLSSRTLPDISKQKLQNGEVFVVSANPQVLEDSREFGVVSRQQIESKALFIWFSFSAEDKAVRWGRILTNLKAIELQH